ncbi:Protein of unknown function [Propionibacterium freudenreichii]|jgi:hypothetical protein
MALE